MESFKEVLEILLLCSEENIIDDEEFPLLYEAYMPQNLRPFLHSPIEHFNSIVCKQRVVDNM